VKLGIDLLCEEVGHESGEFVGALGVDVVSGAFEDREGPETREPPTGASA
jgi:hypothetical protein